MTDGFQMAKSNWALADKFDWPMVEDEDATAPRNEMEHYKKLPVFMAVRSSRSSGGDVDPIDEIKAMISRSHDGGLDMGPGDTHVCRTVCSYCQRVTTKSLSALCWRHCQSGGRAFVACLTFWSIRHEHGLEED